MSAQLPTVLAIVAVMRVAATSTGTSGGRPALVLAALTVACLLPIPALVDDYAAEARSASLSWVINAVQQLERPRDVAPFRLPGELTPPGRCMQVAYGWSAGAFHHYGRRPSCSRYFLSKLVTTEEQRAELRSQVIAGGPAVVLYMPEGADLDVTVPERTTIPWASILDDCYSRRAPGVFVANADERAAVSACIATAIEGGDQVETVRSAPD